MGLRHLLRDSIVRFLLLLLLFLRPGVGCSTELIDRMSLHHVDQLSTGHSSTGINHPTWSFSNDSSRPVGEQAICNITFDVPYDLSEFARRGGLYRGKC